MSLSLAMALANTGIRTFSRYTELTSSNMANAGVDGYHRRELSLTERIIGGQGVGVGHYGPQRVVDLELAYRERKANSEKGFFTSVSNSVKNVLQTIGSNGYGIDTVDSRLAKLQTAFADLQANPQSLNLQKETFIAMKNLTTDINKAAEAIREERNKADLQIGNLVSELNTELKALEAIDANIEVYSRAQRDITALEDERDRIIDSISQKIPIKTFSQPNNRVTVTTLTGLIIFDKKAQAFGFQMSGNFDASHVYVPNGTTPTTGFVDSLSGLTLYGKDISYNSTDGQALKTGSLAGLFNLRDNVYRESQMDLDVVTSGIIDLFQTIDSTRPAGAGGFFVANNLNTETDFTDPALVVGISSRITVNELIDPTRGGNLALIREGIGGTPNPTTVGNPTMPGLLAQRMGSHVINFATFANGAPVTLPPSGNIMEASSSFISNMNRNRIQYENQQKSTEAYILEISSARKLVESVDIDAEVQKLQLFKQLYEANARVIQTVDEMLATIINIKR